MINRVLLIALMSYTSEKRQSAERSLEEGIQNSDSRNGEKGTDIRPALLMLARSLLTFGFHPKEYSRSILLRSSLVTMERTVSAIGGL